MTKILILNRILIYFIAMSFSIHIHAKIKVTRQSGFNFGTIVQGDPPKTIPPGTNENPYNASFLIQGDPQKSFNIILPKKFKMRTNCAGNNFFFVHDLNSFPSADQPHTFDEKGEYYLFVGGTREAIAFDQAPGTYDGEFHVEVIYD